MSSRKPTSKRPGPGAVILGSVALFAVLFALLTIQISAGGGETQATTETATTTTESSLTSRQFEEEAADAGEVDDGLAEEPFVEESYEEPYEEQSYEEPFVEEAPTVVTGAS